MVNDVLFFCPVVLPKLKIGGQQEDKTPKNNKIGSHILTADCFYQFAEMLLNRIAEPFNQPFIASSTATQECEIWNHNAKAAQRTYLSNVLP